MHLVLSFILCYLLYIIVRLLLFPFPNCVTISDCFFLIVPFLYSFYLICSYSFVYSSILSLFKLCDYLGLITFFFHPVFCPVFCFFYRFFFNGSKNSFLFVVTNVVVFHPFFCLFY